jgi:hypothetical protein
MILGDVYGEVPADMKEPLTDIQTSGKHLLRSSTTCSTWRRSRRGAWSSRSTVFGARHGRERALDAAAACEPKGLELPSTFPPTFRWRTETAAASRSA